MTIRFFVCAAYLAIAATHLLVASAAAATEDYVPVPGTHVSLPLPEGFVVADGFAGIGRADSRTSVQVVEMQIPVEQMEREFQNSSEEVFAKNGMTLLHAEPVKAAGRRGVLFHISQNVQGAVFRKWVFVIGDETRSAQLVATTPQPFVEDFGASLRTVLLRARWDADADPDPFEGLGFRVDETPDLQISKVIGGSALVLTRDGVARSEDPGDPLLVIARSVAPVAIPDLATFSKLRLAQTALISGLEIDAENERVVAGMPAYELIGRATHESGRPVTVYQMIAWDGSRYLLAFGRVGEDQANAYVEQFRRVVRSLRMGG